MILFVVNFGVFFASLAMFNYVFSNFPSAYISLQNTAYRLVFATGIIANCLVMPLLLQKCDAPGANPILYVLGMPAGFAIAWVLHKRGGTKNAK